MSTPTTNPSATPAPGAAGPWRVLILDSSPDDPMWMLCTVTLPSDVRPAAMDLANGQYRDWPEVTEWVRAQVGSRVALVPISAVAWRVDEGGQPR